MSASTDSMYAMSNADLIRAAYGIPMITSKMWFRSLCSTSLNVGVSVGFEPGVAVMSSAVVALVATILFHANKLLILVCWRRLLQESKESSIFILLRVKT